ncbi:MAG: PocR ligand-binding domain-containing protein [Candidatus Omnitrophota bacterium]
MDSKLLELVDLKKWQTIQDYFAAVIGSGVRVISPDGTPLTPLSRPHKYCYEVISSSSIAFKKCKDCLALSPQPYSQETLLVERENFLDTPHNIYYDCCPFYANRILIPIRLSSETIAGYIVVGPIVLGKRRTYSEYFNLSKLLELDVTAVIEAVETLRVFSFQSIQSVVHLIQEVANYIIQMKALKQPESNSGTTLSEELYIRKILNALFDSASNCVQAERASLMLLDNRSETLSIEISKGIPEHIVRDTRLRVGEGVSGWAAKEQKVVSIDSRFAQERLMLRLHQPQLKAALIVPIKKGKNVFGVLNLSTSNKDHKFNRKNNNSIIQLADFVGGVFSSISAISNEALT